MKKLYCICDKCESIEKCQTECPKGRAIKPTVCGHWPGWKQDLTGFLGEGDEKTLDESPKPE